MGQLIQRLLIYGRVGGGALRPASCDCEAVLSTVLHSLAADLEHGKATVTHDPLPVVLADTVLVSELLQNLIENAVKYRGEHPAHVHLSAFREKRKWVISVRDNGIGMGDPDRETVFEPFRRLHNVNGSGAGLGLGLATCRRIVERHGGTIWVESVPGRGSAFFFTLPLAPRKD